MGKMYPRAESGICVYVCEKKKTTIFKVYKKCKFPIQKGF